VTRTPRTSRRLPTEGPTIMTGQTMARRPVIDLLPASRGSPPQCLRRAMRPQWKNLPRKVKGCSGVKFEGPYLSGLEPISAVRFHFFDIARDAASGVADCVLCPEKTCPALDYSR
jgi:hypothetical protein